MKEAKEKAKELVNRFEKLLFNRFTTDEDWVKCVESALISVTDTIEALNLLLKSGLNNDFDILKLRGFYMEIKQEIERI